MKNKFTYMGETPAHGKIFKKGIVQIVIYWGGLKRYFPFGCPGKTFERNKEGMNFYYTSNF